MRIHTIFRIKLGIRRVRGKEWASDRVGRENMSHHENLIGLMRTALKPGVYGPELEGPKTMLSGQYIPESFYHIICT